MIDDTSAAKLKAAIDELDYCFWDEDEVHQAEVRLDVLASAMNDVLKTGEDSESAELVDLLRVAQVGDRAVTATEDLIDYARAISYGVSQLESEDVSEATDALATLYAEISEWFERQMQGN